MKILKREEFLKLERALFIKIGPDGVMDSDPAISFGTQGLENDFVFLPFPPVKEEWENYQFVQELDPEDMQRDNGSEFDVDFLVFEEQEIDILINMLKALKGKNDE